MKCPLLRAGEVAAPGEIEGKFTDCLKEECAWWDESVKQCHLLNISEKLFFIYLELDDIAKKMPHLEQFKRP